LRQVMSETGTTQSGLSRVGGVKQPSISQYLSGGTQMSDDMLDRLLSCMGYRLEVVRRPWKVDMDRSGRRRWKLHCQLSTHLDPETLATWTPTLLRNLERLQLGTRGQPHLENLERWSLLIECRDVPGIRRVMTGLDIDSVQMREVSPMGGLLSQDERSTVMDRVGR
jgi:hypothetical protein